MGHVVFHLSATFETIFIRNFGLLAFLLLHAVLIIGLPVTASGEVQQVDDWKVLKMNLKLLRSMISARIDNQLVLCN